MIRLYASNRFQIFGSEADIKNLAPVNHLTEMVKHFVEDLVQLYLNLALEAKERKAHAYI